MNPLMLPPEIFEEAPSDGITDICNHGIAIGTQKNDVREVNQDRAVVAMFTNAGGYVATIALVCDGMGGMEDGDLCAALALSTFLSVAIMSTEKLSKDCIADWIERSNQAVFLAHRSNGGTTMVGVAISGDTVLAFSVGDSRIYAKSATGAVQQVSEDDNVEAEFRRQNLELPTELSRSDLRRISRYVGMGRELQAHIYPVAMDTVESIILATDGAFSPTVEASSIIKHAVNPRFMVSRLLQVSKWSGGLDNATVVALSVCTINHLRSRTIPIPTLTTPDSKYLVHMAHAAPKEPKPRNRKQSDGQSRKSKHDATTSTHTNPLIVEQRSAESIPEPKKKSDPSVDLILPNDPHDTV